MSTAKEIVTTHPGAFNRRQEIILALCRGCDVNNTQGFRASVIADMIVGVANRIIELTDG